MTSGSAFRRTTNTNDWQMKNLSRNTETLNRTAILPGPCGRRCGSKPQQSKTMKYLTCLTTVCAFFTTLAQSAIIIPGADGSDGPLNITSNTVIDLSQAVTGV